MFSVLGIALAISVWSVRAQEGTTNATCFEEFNWMRNSKGQSPCLITAWMSVPCHPNPGWFVSGPLTPGTFYLGPPAGSDVFECQCNTVLYSVYAACAFCQRHTDNLGIANFTLFTENCPAESIRGAVYPENIPDETAIPSWAYLDLLGDRWNEPAASDFAARGVPESTHSSPPSSTSSPLPSTEASTSASSQPASTTTGADSGSPTADSSNTGSTSSKSVVGPAVGGAVGGVALVVLVGAGVFLFLRRRRAQAPPPDLPETAVLSPEHYGYGSHYGLPPESEKTVLYNPDDPSTYPSAQNMSWTHGAPTTGTESGSATTPNTQRDTGYAGRAEIQ
ncbi:hypothetical protein C8Q76DRAFT_417415 [Earliella scabrosa]|nr:hypothetical protein C8Q76DRAFT_417415 [Earliella scabrosa]